MNSKIIEIEIPVREYWMKYLQRIGFSNFLEMFCNEKINIELLNNHAFLIEKYRPMLDKDRNFTNFCQINIEDVIGTLVEVKASSIVVRFYDNPESKFILDMMKTHKITAGIRALGTISNIPEESKKTFRLISIYLKAD